MTERGDRPRGPGCDQAAYHAAASASLTKSRRSCPKNISSPTNMVGAPKTPRSTASAVAALSASLTFRSDAVASSDDASRPAAVRIWQTSGVAEVLAVHPHRDEDRVRSPQIRPATHPHNPAAIRISVMVLIGKNRLNAKGTPYRRANLGRSAPM